MSPPMDIFAFSLLLTIFFGHPLALLAQSTPPISSHITVVGAVYCDTCLNNGFSKHSYFITGADVHIQCKFNANSPKTSEMITVTVNRTTNKYGVYRMEIPSVEGVDCVEGPPIQSFCQASLLGSSSSVCDVPALKATTTEVSVKSRQENLCVYSFTPLSFRPSKRNDTLCREKAEELSNSATSSTATQQTSSKSQAANLQSFPFPFSSPPSLPFPNPFTSPPSLFFPNPFSSPPSLTFPNPFSSPPTLPFPFPFSSPPTSLPFPFPHLPTSPSLPPSFPSPPPPSFNLRDPTTWIPHIPLISTPPPPPPPAFDLRDPRTWTPLIPPFTPSNLQKHNP